ncbi:uncharacterized protein BDW70DRAFT_163829 [Aspergillus foveolatus]|uniref:uncharacterized protein n=1 Tax=Aspergillus foveolatus TaxID=210207 RepID=UPI003CCD820C
MYPCFLTTQASARVHAQGARGQVDVRVHAHIPAPAVQNAALIQVHAHGAQGAQEGRAQILVREEGGEGQEGQEGPVQILVRDDGGEEGQEGQEDSEVYVRAVLRRLDCRIPTVRWARLSRRVGDSPAADQGGRGGPGCVFGGHGGARDDVAAQEAHEDRDRDVLVVRLVVEQGDVRDGGGSSELALNILLRPKVTSTTWLQERGIRSSAALLDPYQPTAR